MPAADGGSRRSRRRRRRRRPLVAKGCRYPRPMRRRRRYGGPQWPSPPPVSLLYPKHTVQQDRSDRQPTKISVVRVKTQCVNEALFISMNIVKTLRINHRIGSCSPYTKDLVVTCNTVFPIPTHNGFHEYIVYTNAFLRQAMSWIR